jgi:2-polyprenyl-3-methyl-5-hydroxy-6-metoxy-1,4-benzoquinol methylase
MIYDVCHEAGGMSKYEWNRDPKRLGFILARYKFVAKMLAGKKAVLEVGCSDGFGSRVVRQTVGMLTAIDIDARAIVEATAQNWGTLPTSYMHADFMSDRMCWVGYDAVYSLDVFEHLENGHMFLGKLRDTADVCIIGTPSRESQQYASALSKQGHINCMSGEELQKACLNHWSHVFMFGMNDETLHTGFMPMSHYLFALCVR